MNTEETQRLVELSREAEWAFPTSFSNSAIVGPGSEGWVERLSTERPSFARAAHVLLERGNEEAATELAANVWRLWLMAGDRAGGRVFLASVLDSGPRRPSRARALALYGDALLAIKQGDIEGSRERAQEALDVATAVDDAEGKVLGLVGLSRVAFEERDYERARSLAHRARELARGLEPAMSQAPLHMLAQSLRMSGDHESAAPPFEESLELNRRIHDEGMVFVDLENLGRVEAHRGNMDAAERYLSEAAERADLDDPYDAAMAEFDRALIAFGRGDRDRAAELLLRAQSAISEHGVELAPDDLTEVEWLDRQLGR